MEIDKTIVEDFERIGFMGIEQVLEVFPISTSSWWAGVKSGICPQPVKLGVRTTAWKRKEILVLIEHVSAEQQIFH